MRPNSCRWLDLGDRIREENETLFWIKRCAFRYDKLKLPRVNRKFVCERKNTMAMLFGENSLKGIAATSFTRCRHRKLRGGRVVTMARLLLITSRSPIVLLDQRVITLSKLLTHVYSHSVTLSSFRINRLAPALARMLQIHGNTARRLNEPRNVRSRRTHSVNSHAPECAVWNSFSIPEYPPFCLPIDVKLAPGRGRVDTRLWANIGHHSLL